MQAWIAVEKLDPGLYRPHVGLTGELQVLVFGLPLGAVKAHVKRFRQILPSGQRQAKAG